MYVRYLDSVCGIATSHRLEGPRIEFRSGRVYPKPVPARPGARASSCTMGIVSLSLRQSGRALASVTHPHLKWRLKKEYSYTSNPPLGLHGLFQGEVKIYLRVRYVWDLSRHKLRILWTIKTCCSFSCPMKSACMLEASPRTQGFQMPVAGLPCRTFALPRQLTDRVTQNCTEAWQLKLAV